MSRNRKYVLATSWNCSNKLTGRKVMMLYLEVMMQLLWWEKTGWRIWVLGSMMCDSARGRLLLHIETSRCTLCRWPGPSSPPLHRETQRRAMSQTGMTSQQRCYRMHSRCRVYDLKKWIGQKCTFRTECIPQRLSLSVRAWERQRVHRVWALIDKSMISVSSSVFESTMPWPHRHAHPNDWLELIPSID